MTSRPLTTPRFFGLASSSTASSSSLRNVAEAIAQAPGSCCRESIHPAFAHISVRRPKYTLGHELQTGSLHLVLAFTTVSAVVVSRWLEQFSSTNRSKERSKRSLPPAQTLLHQGHPFPRHIPKCKLSVGSKPRHCPGVLRRDHSERPAKRHQ